MIVKPVTFIIKLIPGIFTLESMLTHKIISIESDVPKCAWTVSRYNGVDTTGVIFDYPRFFNPSEWIEKRHKAAIPCIINEYLTEAHVAAILQCVMYYNVSHYRFVRIVNETQFVQIGDTFTVVLENVFEFNKNGTGVALRADKSDLLNGIEGI